MTHRTASARLFVAVDPPTEVRRRLAAWARAAARDARGRPPAGPLPAERSRGAPSPGRSRGSAASRLRVLDPDLLHVTLHFLGSRPLEQIDLLAARLAACTGTVGELSVGAPLWLPPRRPRALAVELYDQSGGLARVQAAVVAELGHADPGQTGAASRGRPAEGARRHFRPHVTVARMGHGYAPRERLLPPTPALSFVPGELILYRSWLSPEGASYEPLASCAIG